MENPLKILFVFSEMYPLVSTGGLAEVAGALPRALRGLGHDVRVALPCYRQIQGAARGAQLCMTVADFGWKREHGALRGATAPDSDIPLYLVEHEGYFGREAPYGTGAYEYDDNAERYCFFCMSLLDGVRQTGWRPDVIHCHDWHAAPVPVYLKSRLRNDPFWGGVPVVFTIHNLAFQGRYPASKFGGTGMDPELFSPQCLEYEGDLNLMKGAIALSDKISTVSPRYAQEIQTADYGAGLDGMLAARGADLYGVLNGVDTSLWNPATDGFIAANYDADDLSGKRACKVDLQRVTGMEELPEAPLFGVVGRLYWQKGIDLLLGAADSLLAGGAQLAVLGTGDPDLENGINSLSARHPGRVGVFIGYNTALSHKVMAGSDFFVMPSRYEPCGLAQMYALNYGAVPVVRRTGGLADTVTDITPANLRRGTANGVSFVPATVRALERALERALKLYSEPEQHGKVRDLGMRRDFSWNWSAGHYVTLYKKAAAGTVG